MKTSALFLIAALVGALPVHAANDAPSPEAATSQQTWMTDYGAALKRAAAEGKAVLLNFTGSDWCVWCHRLRDEVFVQRAFQDYARDHLILVELDFPRRKQQDAAVKKQNSELSDNFRIEGYPTVVLVNATGKELGRTGYMAGGAKTFVRELKRFALEAPTPKG